MISPKIPSQKKKKSIKINKEMTIEEILKKYPKAIFVFLDYGFHCIKCPAAQSETLEQAAKVHNVDIKQLLKDLNRTCL